MHVWAMKTERPQNVFFSALTVHFVTILTNLQKDDYTNSCSGFELPRFCLQPLQPLVCIDQAMRLSAGYVTYVLRVKSSSPEKQKSHTC